MNERLIFSPPLLLEQSSIIEGDALIALSRIPANWVQCVITSPPYWGLRDYNHGQQIGLEPTLDSYIDKLVSVFSEIKRILRPDGLLWINIGDGFTSGNRGYRAHDKKNPARAMSVRPDTPDGLKPKDLLGIPWRLALALQKSGWYLRGDIIWNKPNAMPESVKDRPTRSHEYIFMLAKSESYFYDYQANQEVAAKGKTRNRRSVWNVNTQAFSEAHFATFPVPLIMPCIQSSTRENDFVLDPFFGAGTLGVACQESNRKYIGIELSADFVKMAARRLNFEMEEIIRIQ